MSKVFFKIFISRKGAKTQSEKMFNHYGVVFGWLFALGIEAKILFCFSQKRL